MCAMALIIVLSAFNGIESLVGSLYSAFDSDIRITLNEGKTFHVDSFPSDEVRAIPGITYYTNIVEESVGLQYADRTTFATVKGVESDFMVMNGLDSMIVEGTLAIKDGPFNLMVMGRGIQNHLAIQVDGLSQPPVQIFAPNRGKNVMKDKDEAFNKLPINVSGIFSINVDLDMKYVIVPLEFAQELLAYDNEITAVELSIAEGADEFYLKEQLQALLGDKYDVSTRYEQNSLIYETTKTEKWITFMILSLILLIATFNVVASLSMLVLDKKQDVNTLMSMGATRTMIRKIFFTEGMMINLVGGIVGIFVGFLCSWGQQTFGFVELQNSIVQYYPIKMIGTDFVAVFSIVLVIGALASWLPVRYLTRKNFSVTA